MVTQADAIQRCRERLGEPKPALYTDPELAGWLNEAARTISRKTEALRETMSIPIVVGTGQYALNTGTPAISASNIIRIHRVEYQRTGDTTRYPLMAVEVNHADELGYSSGDNYTGTPNIYFIWGWGPSSAGSTAAINLFPTPSDTGSILVYLYRFAADLATDGSASFETLEIPTGWEDLAYDYVEYRARLKDRDPQWQAAKAAFQENLSDMFSLTRQYTDAPQYITAPVGRYIDDDWGYW